MWQFLLHSYALFPSNYYYIYIYVWNHCEYSDHAIQAIILSHLWLKWTNMQIRFFFPRYIVLFVILCDGCFFTAEKKGIKGTCPITSYSRFWAVFITTYKGRLSSLIYYNWHEILFFSNNACRPMHIAVRQISLNTFFISTLVDPSSRPERYSESWNNWVRAIVCFCMSCKRPDHLGFGWTRKVAVPRDVRIECPQLVISC